MITATYRPLSNGPRPVGTKGSKLVGTANVTLTTGEGEDFVINSVKVMEAEDGHNYIQMPSFNVGRDEPRWIEPAHPITTGGRAALEAAVLAAKDAYVPETAE